jgi:vacuolar-type H+-ATPase subunit I/STV1
MLFGTCLRISNFIYQKKWIDMIFEGFTQFVMLSALFGMMDIMIIGKWLTDWDKMAEEEKLQPPGVIMAMIVMFLSGGVYDKLPGEKTLQWGPFISNQT